MESLKLERSKNKSISHGIYLKYTIPLFSGVLCSLFLCALISVSFNIFMDLEEPEIPVVVAESEGKIGNFLLSRPERARDPVLEYFSDPEYRQWVLDFFSNICANQEIVLAILENAESFNVPPSLAFAVCWEESRFNSNAVNWYNRDESIDRGLFQLNSRSFPNLNNSGFFDIRVNSYYGVGHLKYCLDTGKNEVSALAMYNAGTGRVKASGAPEVTLNYISRILDNKSKIEDQFYFWLIKEEEIRLAEARPAEKDEKTFQLSRTSIIPAVN